MPWAHVGWCVRCLQPLPEVVDLSVIKCPIDTRRRLYGNIVLSGGSTMFKDFGKRLQRDVQKIVKDRMKVKIKVGGGEVDGSKVCTKSLAAKSAR